MGRKAGIPAETLLSLRRRLASLPARAPERREEIARVAARATRRWLLACSYAPPDLPIFHIPEGSMGFFLCPHARRERYVKILKAGLNFAIPSSPA